MSDTTCHLDQLLQRTEADITILRTRPLSTDSATRSAQNVERRAVEVARSLSRIGAQLESLAKEVLATSASVDLARTTTLHLAKDTTQGVGYANGQPVATPPGTSSVNFEALLSKPRIIMYMAGKNRPCFVPRAARRCVVVTHSR